MFDKTFLISFCSLNEGIFILIFFISFLLISRNVEPDDLLKNSFFIVEIK